MQCPRKSIDKVKTKHLRKLTSLEALNNSKDCVDEDRQLTGIKFLQWRNQVCVVQGEKRDT